MLQKKAKFQKLHITTLKRFTMCSSAEQRKRNTRMFCHSRSCSKAKGRGLCHHFVSRVCSGNRDFFFWKRHCTDSRAPATCVRACGLARDCPTPFVPPTSPSPSCGGGPQWRGLPWRRTQSAASCARGRYSNFLNWFDRSVAPYFHFSFVSLKRSVQWLMLNKALL